MNQQINLYQPIFRREKKVFSMVAMLQVTAVMAIALGAVYGFGAWQARALKAELSAIAAQRDGVARQVALLEERYPKKAKSKVLEGQIEQLAVEIAKSRQILAGLLSGKLGDTGGFANRMEALARRHVAGTWLTGVSISQGGQSVGISGSTLAPELVPVYLQRLAEESVFAGLAFNVMEMERPESNPGRVDFIVRTEKEEP